MADVPAILFQWWSAAQKPGEQSDIDEPKAIRDALITASKNPAGVPFEIPDNAACTCRKTTGADALADLRALLKANSDVQTVYFSAHGAPGQSFYHKNGKSISFTDFGKCLGESLTAECVTVVLGSCFAASNGIEKHMPSNVRVIWGFSKTPTAREVSDLMAAIMEDDARLMRELSAQAGALADAANAKGIGNVNAVDHLGPVVDKHVSQIAQWFKTKKLANGNLLVIERNETMPDNWLSPKPIV